MLGRRSLAGPIQSVGKRDTNPPNRLINTIGQNNGRQTATRKRPRNKNNVTNKPSAKRRNTTKNTNRNNDPKIPFQTNQFSINRPLTEDERREKYIKAMKLLNRLDINHDFTNCDVKVNKYESRSYNHLANLVCEIELNKYTNQEAELNGYVFKLCGDKHMETQLCFLSYQMFLKINGQTRKGELIESTFPRLFQEKGKIFAFQDAGTSPDKFYSDIEYITTPGTLLDSAYKKSFFKTIPFMPSPELTEEKNLQFNLTHDDFREIGLENVFESMNVSYNGKTIENKDNFNYNLVPNIDSFVKSTINFSIDTTPYSDNKFLGGNVERNEWIKDNLNKKNQDEIKNNERKLSNVIQNTYKWMLVKLLGDATQTLYVKKFAKSEKISITRTCIFTNDTWLVMRARLLGVPVLINDRNKIVIDGCIVKKYHFYSAAKYIKPDINEDEAKAFIKETTINRVNYFKELLRNKGEILGSYIDGALSTLTDFYNYLTGVKPSTIGGGSKSLSKKNSYISYNGSSGVGNPNLNRSFNSSTVTNNEYIERHNENRNNLPQNDDLRHEKINNKSLLEKINIKSLQGNIETKSNQSNNKSLLEKINNKSLQGNIETESNQSNNKSLLEKINIKSLQGNIETENNQGNNTVNVLEKIREPGLSGEIANTGYDLLHFNFEILTDGISEHQAVLNAIFESLQTNGFQCTRVVPDDYREPHPELCKDVRNIAREKARNNSSIGYPFVYENKNSFTQENPIYAEKVFTLLFLYFHTISEFTVNPVFYDWVLTKINLGNFQQYQTLTFSVSMKEFVDMYNNIHNRIGTKDAINYQEIERIMKELNDC